MVLASLDGLDEQSFGEDFNEQEFAELGETEQLAYTASINMCMIEAIDQTTQAVLDVIDQAAVLEAEIQLRLLADPSVSAASRTWSRCLANAGSQFPQSVSAVELAESLLGSAVASMELDESGKPSASDLRSLGALERSEAVIVVQCLSESNVQETVDEAYERLVKELAG